MLSDFCQIMLETPPFPAVVLWLKILFWTEMVCRRHPLFPATCTLTVLYICENGSSEIKAVVMEFQHSTDSCSVVTKDEVAICCDTEVLLHACVVINPSIVFQYLFFRNLPSQHYLITLYIHGSIHPAVQISLWLTLTHPFVALK